MKIILLFSWLSGDYITMNRCSLSEVIPDLGKSQVSHTLFRYSISRKTQNLPAFIASKNLRSIISELGSSS